MIDLSLIVIQLVVLGFSFPVFTLFCFLKQGWVLLSSTDGFRTFQSLVLPSCPTICRLSEHSCFVSQFLALVFVDVSLFFSFCFCFLFLKLPEFYLIMIWGLGV